jgi:hypothetical protein
MLGWLHRLNRRRLRHRRAVQARAAWQPWLRPLRAFDTQLRRMQVRGRWSRWLDNDPANNPNASLKSRNFEFTVAERPRACLSRPWFEGIV